MNKRVVLVLTLLLTLPAVAIAAQMALAPGDRAPLLAGRNLSGELIGVSYDKLTIVNFWATWCEPCIREMPVLEGLHRSWSDKGLQIVGVVHEQIGYEELTAFVERLGVTYPVLMPRRRTSGDWGGVATLPVTFLIDGKGKILRRYVGAAPEQIDALKYDVEATLEGRPLGPLPLPKDPDVVRSQDRESKAAEKP